jgi:hypothetical protein
MYRSPPVSASFDNRLHAIFVLGVRQWIALDHFTLFFLESLWCLWRVDESYALTWFTARASGAVTSEGDGTSNALLS